MGKLLKAAFEKRFGRQDHESFADVVEAFFQEYADDSNIVQPIMLKGNGLQPVFAKLKNGKDALVIVTDVEYMRYFTEQSYVMTNPKTLVKIMKDNEYIDGIIINPFSTSNCFLPRSDILGALDQLGWDY